MIDISEPGDSKWRTHIIHLIGGCWSGLVSDVILHPIGTLRARLMVEQTRSTLSLFEYARTVVKAEGWSTLFRGIGLVSVGTVPGSALFYVGYEGAKARFSQPDMVNYVSPDTAHFFAGGVATACGSIIYQPLEVVVQKAQTGACGLGVNGSLATLRYVLRTSGVYGLFQGYAAAQLTWLPYFSLYFVVYERLKALAATAVGGPERESGAEWSAAILSCGAGAGAIAGAATCPVDVVKTRIQVGRSGANSIASTVQHLWYTEGARGFTRGMSARVMWLAPGSAIGITAYEFAKERATVLLLK